jgi:uncharacterized protein YcfL
MRTRGLAIALALVLGCSHKPSPVETPVETTKEPSTAAAVGGKAPDGQLSQASGTKIALASVLHEHAQSIVVFYRGFW